MKYSIKYYLLASSLLLITLSGCTRGNDGGSQSSAPVATGGVSSISEPLNPDIAMHLQQLSRSTELIQQSTKMLEQSKPEVTEAKKHYDKGVSEVAKTLGIDTYTAEKSLQKYQTTLVDYQKLIGGTENTGGEQNKTGGQNLPVSSTATGTNILSVSTYNTTPTIATWTSTPSQQNRTLSNPALVEKYEAFLIKNLWVDGVRVDKSSLRDLAVTTDFSKLQVESKKLDDYMLPDGTLVDLDMKKSFEDFKAGNERAYTDDMMALEAFKINMYFSELEYNKQCDQITDEVRKANCKILWSR